MPYRNVTYEILNEIDPYLAQSDWWLEFSADEGGDCFTHDFLAEQLGIGHYEAGKRLSVLTQLGLLYTVSRWPSTGPWERDLRLIWADYPVAVERLLKGLQTGETRVDMNWGRVRWQGEPVNRSDLLRSVLPTKLTGYHRGRATVYRLSPTLDMLDYWESQDDVEHRA